MHSLKTYQFMHKRGTDKKLSSEYARDIVDQVRQNTRFRIISLHPLYFAIAAGVITENSTMEEIVNKIDVERIV